MTTETKPRKKGPSQRSLLLAARNEATEHKAHAEKLAKDLESAKGMQKHYSDRAEKADAELSNIGAFLDAVPNPPPRKTDPAVTGDYSARDINVSTRLSVFLATR